MNALEHYENNATNRQGEERSHTWELHKRDWELLYKHTTHMPLQNESKINDNWMKGRPPRKNTEVLLDFSRFLISTFILSEISHSHDIGEAAHTTQWRVSADTWWWPYTARTCGDDTQITNGLHCGRKCSVWMKSLLMQKDA